ncbi:MAG: MopE-related protein [Pseudomonadota bacterium]
MGDGFGDAATSTAACSQPSDFVSDDSDCDDSVDFVFPGAAERCDGVDDDCDGAVDEDDAVDALTWYADADADGFGAAASPTTACRQPSGFVADATDCDDTVDYVFPGADERCDGLDDDCDGAVDEDDAIDALTWFADTDGDGFGDASTSTAACAQPTGFVADGTDCDDASAATFPGADERCDGLDDDCDGTVDEDEAVDTLTWFADTDGDGFGDAGDARPACAQPIGFVADDTDCDDTSATTFPGADERCDGLDDDCDGVVDEDDAIDALTWYADGDGDGFGAAATSATACAQPTGFVADATDCDDTSAATFPGADERCDGVDDDCDGAVDEADAIDAPTWHPDVDGDGYGQSGGAVVSCAAPSGYALPSTDCDDGDASVNPGEDERCDGVDDDCDGTVDEGDAVDATTWYLDDDDDGYGSITDTLDACTQPSGYLALGGDCDDSDPDVSPSAREICDGADDDCDGVVDDDCVTCDLTVATDGTGDYSSIITAISHASDGDTVCVGPGSYVESSCVSTGGLAVQILGVAGSSETVVDSASGCVFCLSNGETASTIIEGLTISGGYCDRGGGIYLYGASPTLRNLVVTANTGVYGGGIAARQYSRPLIENTMITYNYAWTRGGGLAIEDYSDPILNNVVIAGNQAIDTTGLGNGAGIALRDAAMSLYNVAILQNVSGWDGAGIHQFSLIWPGDVVLDHVVIADNSINYIMGVGGGIVPGWNPTTIRDSVICNNYAPRDGGGIAGSISSILSFENTIVYQNSRNDFWYVADTSGTDTTTAPDFLSYSAWGSWDTWDLHLAATSALVDAGSGLDPDGSPADIGVYGGELADDWDLDADGYPEHWRAGPYGYDDYRDGYDCDDRDPEVTPASGDCTACTWEVPGDFATIQDAIDAASDGEVICVGAGTYHEHLSVWSKDLELVGIDGPAATVIDAGYSGWGAQFGESTSQMTGFTVQHADSTTIGGGIMVYLSDVALAALDIRDNAAVNGAGIYVHTGSTVSLHDSVLQQNVASNDGGGVFVLDGSQLTMWNVLVAQNEAVRGGGVVLEANATASLGATAIFGNTASDHTGGLYVGDGSVVELTSAVIDGNQAATYAGGLFGIGTIEITFTNAIIADNVAPLGAQIAIDSTSGTATLTFDHCDLYPTTADDLYGITDPTGSDGNVSVAPDFLDTSASSAVDWDLHLALSSPLIDAGTGYDASDTSDPADLGVYGGVHAGTWDLDGDGYRAWYQPGAYDSATYPALGLDCDDRDPEVYPGAGC